MIPGRRRLDLNLTRKLLDLTDFEYKEIRSLQLYVRPFKDNIFEVVVLDNELPIYHTSVEDVALRKSPFRNEMFKLRNIIKIIFDKDVVVSRGKESVKKIHEIALQLLNLKYNKDDLALIVADANWGIINKSNSHIEDAFDLFFEILGFRSISFGEVQDGLQLFGRPKSDADDANIFEHIIFYEERNVSIGLEKGNFSTSQAADFERVGQYLSGEHQADLKGVDVFEFLSELAMESAQV